MKTKRMAIGGNSPSLEGEAEELNSQAHRQNCLVNKILSVLTKEDFSTFLSY